MADRVVLLEQGRIVADGTHHELLATNARYRAVLAASERDEPAHERAGAGTDGR
jgi:ATP-binding cassette subfamily B protein